MNTYGQFENVVCRHLRLAKCTESDFTQFHEEFLKGNWSLFGIWARAILLKKFVPPKSIETTCVHGKAFAQILVTKSDTERDQLLRFLLRAGMANRVFKERANKKGISSTTPLVVEFVTNYLAAFSPKMDKETSLGERLTVYGNIPDERMIELAGSIGAHAAIPKLAAFLGLQRRFYHIQMDCPYEPRRVVDLFLPSLRALVRMQANEQIKAAMAAETELEKVIWETYSHNNFDNSSSQSIEERNLSEGHGLKTKHQWLSEAFAGKDIFSCTEKEPFEWTTPAEQGQALVSKDKLYLLSNFQLEVLDLASGKALNRLSLGRSADNKGINCYNGKLTLSTEGKAIMVCQLSSNEDTDFNDWRLFQFSKEDFEIEFSYGLTHQPVRAWGPTTWPQKNGLLFWLHEEKKVWRQDNSGTLCWELDVPEGAVVRANGKLLAVLSDKSLSLYCTDDGRQTLKLEMAKWKPDCPMRDEVVLRRDGGFYLFSRQGHAMRFSPTGEVLWKKEPADAGYWLTDLQACEGDGYCGFSSDKFAQMSAQGDLRLFKTLSNRKSHLWFADHLYIHRGEQLHHWKLDSETPLQKAIDLPTFQTELKDICSKGLVGQYFLDGWHLFFLAHK